MSRLIDADELIGGLENLCDVVCQYSKKQREVMCGACPLGSAFDVVDDFPTVDAVPVVRCKDCKHRDPEDKKCDSGHFIQWQLPRDDDWFCADGEKVTE